MEYDKICACFDCTTMVDFKNPIDYDSILANFNVFPIKTCNELKGS